MKVKNLIYYINPPCSKCPYKLGLNLGPLHTIINPCPNCKKNGYWMFEQFQRIHRGPVLTFQQKVPVDKQK